MAAEMDIAVNNYNFQWTFPEMVADGLGLFSKRGLEIRWHDVTPKEETNKSVMYTELLRNGTTDIYHAGEWVCILRVLDSPESRLVSKSVPGPGTLNSTFSLFVRKGSGYQSPRDLRDRPVAIEVGTGSYYTTVQDLERFVPRERMKLVQVGEPHKRFLALLEGRVEAASLLSPWTDLTERAGLTEILRTERSNPTVVVARKDQDPVLLGRFFSAVNEAMDAINADQGRFAPLYCEKVEQILGVMPPEFRGLGPHLRGSVVVPRWNHWLPYTREDFQGTYKWMVERDLAPAGRTYDEAVAANSGEIFS